MKWSTALKKLWVVYIGNSQVADKWNWKLNILKFSNWNTPNNLQIFSQPIYCEMFKKDIQLILKYEMILEQNYQDLTKLDVFL